MQLFVKVLKHSSLFWNGRRTTAIEVALDIVKFWIHILKAEPTTILHDCYQYHISIMQDEKCWLSVIRDILLTLGFEEIWYNQNVQNEKVLERQLKVVIQEWFVSQLRQQLYNDQGSENGNKLRIYRKFKSNFEFEPYLHYQKDIHLRKT